MILNTLASTLVALSIIGVANAHPGESVKLMSRDDHAALKKRTIQAKTCQDATDLFMQNRRAKRGLHTKRNFVSSPSMVMTPELQEGPYYINNELVRDDVREDSPGIDLTFEFQILDLHTCGPLQNGFVEIWSANATGQVSPFLLDVTARSDRLFIINRAYGGFGDASMGPPGGPDDGPGRRPGKVEPGQPGGPAGPQHPESGKKPKDHKKPHKDHNKDHNKPHKDHDRPPHKGHHGHHDEHGSPHNGDDHPRKGKHGGEKNPKHGQDDDHHHKHHDHKRPDHDRHGHDHHEHDHHEHGPPRHEHGPPRHGPPREHGPHEHERDGKHKGPKHREHDDRPRHNKRSDSFDEEIMDLNDAIEWPGHRRPKGPGEPGGPGGPGGPGRGGPPMESNASFLRGGNVVGEDGNLTLITKWPGYYHGRCPHVHLLVHTDYEINENGTLASKKGDIVHIGQMFFPESWNDEVFTTDGYEGNTNQRTYNSEDHDVAALIAADYPPYVHVEMLGEDIYEGLIAYVTVVVDSSVQRQVRSKNYATTFTYDAPEATASSTGSYVAASHNEDDEEREGGVVDMVKALADIPAQALRLWRRAE